MTDTAAKKVYDIDLYLFAKLEKMTKSAVKLQWALNKFFYILSFIIFNIFKSFCKSMNYSKIMQCTHVNDSVLSCGIPDIIICITSQEVEIKI